MSYSPKRPGVIRAALCAVALLSALAAAPAMLSKTAAAQGASPGLGGAVWTDVSNPKATASSASAALDCHGSTPPASFPKGPKPYPCGQVLVTGNFYAPIERHEVETVRGQYVQITSLDDTASLYEPGANKGIPLANLQNTCAGGALPWKDGNNIPCHAYRTATLLDPPGCHGGTPDLAPGYPCGKVLVQGPYDSYRTISSASGQLPDAYGGNRAYPARPSGDSQLYDPTTDSWTPIPVPAGEHGHMGWNSEAVLLANGGVLVTPSTFPSKEIGPDGSPLLYVPTATGPGHPLGTWFRTPVMASTPLANTPGGSASLLSDGNRVFALGEYTSNIYDPVGVSPAGHGVWSATGPMPYNVYGATATTLIDGRVIVVGGNIFREIRPGPDAGFGIVPVPNTQPDGVCRFAITDLCGSTSVLIYDPVTNTWAKGAPLPNPRVFHSANLLPDGRVLVVGGYAEQFDSNGDPTGLSVLSSTVIYDPAALPGQEWRSGPSMGHGRGVHTTALLPFAGCDAKALGTPVYLCSRLVAIGGQAVPWNGRDPDLQLPDWENAAREPTAEMLVPPPLITGLTPNRGPATRSTPVKVAGFAFAGSNLSFDGAPAPPCAASGCPSAPSDPDTSILIMAPPRNTNAEVSVPVKATTTLPGGQVLESNSLPFTYFISPVLSGIDPVCGPEAGGTTVTLTGLQLTGADQVFFGDKVAAPKVLLDTKLTVEAPPHSAGEVQVTVGKTGDRSEGSLKFNYPCPVPPLIKTDTVLNGGNPINPPAAPRPPVVQAAQLPGPAPASAPNVAVPGPGVHAIPQAPAAAPAAPQVQAQVQGLTQTQAQTAVHTQTQAAVQAQPVAALLVEPQAHIQIEGVRGPKSDSSWLASTRRAPAPVVSLVILSGLMALLPLALKPKPNVGLPTARVTPRSRPAPRRANRRRR